jgi:hypothetical protein
MDKELLEKLIREGKSTRQIQQITGVGNTMVGYYAKKYELNHLFKYQQKPSYAFNKIDTKEKAYILGFILADGHISEKDSVSITVQQRDCNVIEFIAQYINGFVTYSNVYNKESRIFPHTTTIKCIKDIRKFVGGRLKNDRHYPIVKPSMEKYLLQGVFDADGCITWGRRKDKNRIWQKISFTSSLNILLGIQQMLLKHLDISTSIFPKGSEKCFVLSFANKKDVIKFLDYIYADDFIILKRKYLKSNALRLELEENGGNLQR